MPVLIANLSVSLLFCGLLLREVRRFRRKADEIERRLEVERGEVVAEMVATTDRRIAEYIAKGERP